MDMYNDKVKGRTLIAEALQTTYRGIAVQVGLLDEDLAAIATEGRRAEQAIKRGHRCASPRDEAGA